MSGSVSFDIVQCVIYDEVVFSLLIYSEDQRGCFQLLYTVCPHVHSNVAAANTEDLSRKTAV